MNECVENYFIENGSLVSVNSFSNNSVLKENSIYEVFRIIDGVPVFIEKHYERLEKSFDLLNKNTSVSLEELKRLVKELCKKNNVLVGNMKLVCNTIEDNKYFLYFIKHRYPTNGQYKEGVTVASFSFERENPNAKLIKSNYKKITEKIIREKEVFELVLIDSEGYILEGSKSNIFMIKGDNVLTCPKETVLKGITRELIYDICMENEIAIMEEKFPLTRINELDAMFITGTSPKVLPIVNLDGVKHFSDNKILRLIHEEYDKKIDNYISSYKLKKV